MVYRAWFHNFYQAQPKDDRKGTALGKSEWMTAISRPPPIHYSPYAPRFFGTTAHDKSIVCMVGDHPPILCTQLDLVGHNIGISIDTQNPAVQSNHLIRSRVIEIEHVID